MNKKIIKNINEFQLLLTTIIVNSFSSFHVEMLALGNIVKSRVEDWNLVDH